MGTLKLIDAFATSNTWAGGFKTVSCSRQGCSRWLTQRHLSSRRVGVNFRGSWYCTYKCFASTAEQRFVQLLTDHNRPSKQHRARMPIGLTLVSRGWLSDDQFRQANEEHKKTGTEMADVLMRFGFVDEQKLTKVRALQWGCPVYSVPSRTLPSPVQVPATLSSLYSLLPLQHNAATNTLMVGFIQGIEYGPLYAIEQITGCKAQPCLITPSDYYAQLEAQREGVVPEEFLFEDASGPAEMARILCNYGVQLDADEIAIVRCREYIWARVKGGLKSADLLFKTA